MHVEEIRPNAVYSSIVFNRLLCHFLSSCIITLQCPLDSIPRFLERERGCNNFLVLCLYFVLVLYRAVRKGFGVEYI